METKNFILDDLFYKVKTKSLPYKVAELPSLPNIICNLPAITAGILNQGISCYVPREEATVISNAITVSANGANSGACFYQDIDFTILQDSYALKYKHQELNKYHYLYFVTILNQVFQKYNWNNKAGWNKVKNIEISLPINSENEIDLIYIENYIKNIEKDCINRLNTFVNTSL